MTFDERRELAAVLRADHVPMPGSETLCMPCSQSHLMPVTLPCAVIRAADALDACTCSKIESGDPTIATATVQTSFGRQWKGFATGGEK